jgi:hypothetical protein
VYTLYGEGQGYEDLEICNVSSGQRSLSSGRKKLFMKVNIRVFETISEVEEEVELVMIYLLLIV